MTGSDKYPTQKALQALLHDAQETGRRVPEQAVPTEDRRQLERQYGKLVSRILLEFPEALAEIHVERWLCREWVTLTFAARAALRVCRHQLVSAAQEKLRELIRKQEAKPPARQMVCPGA